MDDRVKVQEIGDRINTFLLKLHTLMQNPQNLTQEDGIELISQVNAILEDMDKLENPERFAMFKVQFEQAKYALQMAMMTSPEDVQ